MTSSDDCSVFIGLASVPNGTDKEFFNNEFKEGIFKQYRKKLQEFASCEISGSSPETYAGQLDRFFYRPRAYCIFGGYDLAILSLIDDYSLPSRNFHPYNSFLLPEDASPSNYNYRIITGSCPVMGKNDNPESGLLKRSLETFLKDISSNDLLYPFIGIVSLKINNGLLVGSGNTLISLAINKIEELIVSESDANIHHIIIESFDWSEIVLVLFSDSYKTIGDVIIKIRELKFKSIENTSNESIINEIVERSLLNKFIKSEVGSKASSTSNGPNYQVKDSHLFVELSTLLGADHEYIYASAPEELQKFYPVTDDEENALELITSWDIRPGHLAEGHAVLSHLFGKQASEFSSDQILLSFGQGISLFPSTPYPHKMIRQFAHDVAEDLDFSKHIKTFRTTPQYKIHTETFTTSERIDFNVHYSFNKKLNSYTYSRSEFEEIRKGLSKARLSKILTQKVLNMFVNYNYGILDTSLFIFFIELKPFLNQVKADVTKIQSKKGKPAVDSHKTLEGHCDDFEKAFKNRFFQSQKTQNITDYNLELNGGIQQLASAYSCAYDILIQQFHNTFVKAKDTNFSPHGLVFISGFSGVDSSKNTVRLNYFHIFQPEIFISIATHEALNFFTTQLYKPKLAEDTLSAMYDALLDPGSSQHTFEYKVFLRAKSFLNAEFIRYITVDLLTCYCAYYRDLELFNYWQWFYFLQKSDEYDLDGELNEDRFLKFLVRMVILNEIVDPQYLDRSIFAPCSQIQPLWGKYFLLIRKLVKKTMRHKVVEKIVEELHFKAIHIFKKNSKIKDSAKGEKGEGIIENKNKYESEIRSNISKGNIIEFQTQSFPDSEYSFIQRLFYAYLKHLYGLGSVNDLLLFRDDKGIPVKPMNTSEKVRNRYSSYLADPAGGVFVNDPAVKREVFKYRNAIIKSLIHLSQKRKVSLFEQS